MASVNPFDLLGDDAEDPSHLNLVTAPLPTTQPRVIVSEPRNDTSRGPLEAARGRGRAQAAFPGLNANPSETESLSYGGPRAPYRGAGRAARPGFANGEARDDAYTSRPYDRRSGTGRGNEFKREGAGRPNWGSQTHQFSQVTEQVNDTAKNFGDEKPSGEDDVAADGNKDSPANEAEEKEPEDKEMTLEEYEQVLEERRKALQTLKTEERKVDTKVFESMQQLSNKKDNDDIFIKLGSDKDKRKEALEKEEKSKKSVSINEFLKPPEGESYYNPGGRGRGRGGRGRGARGSYGGYATANIPAPAIGDPGQFPILGVKWEFPVLC